MAPSEKEKIIKEGFDAIRKVYNLRDDLLEDAGKLEAARESNCKLSDRVANLEVTIKTLNAAIDKKDVEIRALKATIEALEKNRDNIYDAYLELAHKRDADEDIKKQMISDNRKKKNEIKSLKEELDLLRKDHTKLCCDYKTTVTEENFHELRNKLSKLYLYHVHEILETKDFMLFFDWFKDTFGDFGVYDEEE